MILPEAKHFHFLLSCSLLHFGSALLFGCHIDRSISTRRFERIVVSDSTHFAIDDGQGRRSFRPWGFNYDRAGLDGRDVLLEDILSTRPSKLDDDFAAMRRLGGNTVRVFIATRLILAGPGEVNESGVAQVLQLLQAAHRHGLWVILTGLANIQPTAAPRWIQEADDETINAAEKLFWRTVARACRDAPAVFAYDLQNEPAIHSKNSESWTDGCFNMPSGPRFCYVHRHYRRIEARWTQYVHNRFVTADALKKHWTDFPRAGETWESIAVPVLTSRDGRYGEYIMFHAGLLHDWAAGLRESIRSEDAGHLITLGALDSVPMADAVDFYSLHFYPQKADSAEAFRTQNRKKWQAQLGRLPPGKPAIVEEMYPLALAPGVTYDDYLKLFLDVTRSRVAGYVSFYWGRPETLPGDKALQAALYGRWLETWARHLPGKSDED